MATINKRPSGKWQATVRRDGRSRSRTFSKRADAVKWARKAEQQAERGEWQARSVGNSESEIRTLADALRRFREEVTPLKRSAMKERFLIDKLMRERLCRCALDELTPAMIAAHREERLRVVKPATVCRALGVMQQAVDTATREWGVQMSSGNPFKQVRKPRIDNRRERRLQRASGRH